MWSELNQSYDTGYFCANKWQLIALLQIEHIHVSKSANRKEAKQAVLSRLLYSNFLSQAALTI